MQFIFFVETDAFYFSRFFDEQQQLLFETETD